MTSEAEKEFLERLERAPDGFAKAWGYAMYGLLKACEVSVRVKERQGVTHKDE
jgi:hypothetical protein